MVQHRREITRYAVEDVILHNDSGGLSLLAYDASWSEIARPVADRVNLYLETRTGAPLTVHGHGLWLHSLSTLAGALLFLPQAATEEPEQLRLAGTECAGAAAALTGAVTPEQLAEAVRQELAGLSPALQARNLELALAVFARLAPQRGLLHQAPEAPPRTSPAPDWVELTAEPAQIAAPAIHATLTSERSQTGLWRSLRPEIDYSRCGGCWWVCSSVCPDGAIQVDDDGRPRIDYDHCKGCLVCVAQCPPHAIEARPEHAPAEAAP